MQQPVAVEIRESTKYITVSVTAQMNQITGPHDASIHRPIAANGKNTASVTVATCQ